MTFRAAFEDTKNESPENPELLVHSVSKKSKTHHRKLWHNLFHTCNTGLSQNVNPSLAERR